MRDPIVSLQNARIKRVRFLRTAKGRRKEGAFVVEGLKMVTEALRDCPDAIEEIYTTDEALSHDFPHPYQLVTKTVFADLTAQKTPQGILAVIRTDRIPHKPRAASLLLDGVSDPGNMGTLLRTAEAFDFGVWLTPDCADPLNPKAVQASMGAVLRHMPRTFTLDEVQRISRERPFIGASLEGEWGDRRWSSDAVLVLGSEAHGIRKEINALLDFRVRIPMVGQTESLNVAVAGGVLMYEGFRQRM